MFININNMYCLRNRTFLKLGIEQFDTCLHMKMCKKKMSLTTVYSQYLIRKKNFPLFPIFTLGLNA
jgi:hypothetical protein